MGISINGESAALAQVVVSATKPAEVKRRPPRTGSAKPRPVTLDLSQPGRLRVGHLLTLLGISSASLYRLINEGKVPAADGRMGRSPYWNTSTVRKLLDGGAQ